MEIIMNERNKTEKKNRKPTFWRSGIFWYGKRCYTKSESCFKEPTPHLCIHIIIQKSLLGNEFPSIFIDLNIFCDNQQPPHYHIISKLLNTKLLIKIKLYLQSFARFHSFKTFSVAGTTWFLILDFTVRYHDKKKCFHKIFHFTGKQKGFSYFISEQ